MVAQDCASAVVLGERKVAAFTCWRCFSSQTLQTICRRVNLQSGGQAGMYSRRQNMPAGMLVFLLCMLLQSGHCGTYEEFVAATLSDVCPYSTFCTMGPAKQFKSKKKSPCCKPCSCDDYCLITGNCCPDYSAKLNTSVAILPTAQCSAPIHHMSEHYRDNIKALPSYYNMHTCPETYTNMETVRKCTQPETLDLTERVMVSDQHGRVFYNRYCAECNNVTSYTKWDMQLLCTAYSHQLSGLNAIAELDRLGCLLISSPPTSTISSTSGCYQATYASCNITGRWATHDPHIERACGSTTLPYVKELTLSKRIYSNPFCHMCNEYNGTPMPKMCFMEKNWRTDLSSTFSAVVDVNTRTYEPAKARCDSYSIYDYHFNICRLLHCPLTFIPKSGKCVKMFKMAVGLQMYIQIDASYGDDDTRMVFDIPRRAPLALIREMAASISANIGIKTSPCESCTGLLVIRRNNTGLVFLLGWRTTIKCTPTAMIDLLNRWRLKEMGMSVTSGEQRLALSLRIGDDVDTLITFGDDRFIATYVIEEPKLHPPACYEPNFVRPKFYCAFVDIPRSDYKQITSKEGSHVQQSDFSVVRRHGNYTGNQTETDYRICVDRYLIKQNASVPLIPNLFLFMVICFLATVQRYD